MARLLNVYFSTRSILLVTAEALLISGCCLVVWWAVLGQDVVLALNYEYGWVKIAVLTLVVMIFSYYSNLYESELLFDRREIYFRILLSLGSASLLLSCVLYAFPEFGLTGHAFSLSILVLSVVLCAWRRFYAWIATRSLFRESIYVLGRGAHAQSVADVLKRRQDLGMNVVGCHYEFYETGARDEHAEGAVRALLALRRPPQHVVIAMEDRRAELPMTDLLTLKFRGVFVEEASNMMERLNGKIQLDGLRPSDFLYSDGFRHRKSQQFTRRMASIVAASVGLLLFAPFFPVVVALIRLSSRGPIFFEQIRVGEGGRHFAVYKFRSMRTDAEAAGARWAVKNDPRVTRVGSFLRKTRIDEVPQLWNVLRGDMGFVGPRPERPEFVPWLAEQLPFYNLRHMIRPGLTGWAQVRYGYGATLEESREKLAYDLYYVKHASLGFDLLIMFETIKIILHRKGAQ